YLMQRVFTDDGVSTVVLDSSVDSRVLNYLTIPSPTATLPAELRVAGNNAVYAFDPRFRNPRSGQVSLSVEQRLDKDTTVTVGFVRNATWALRSEEHTSELQSRGHLVCRLLLEKKKIL